MKKLAEIAAAVAVMVCLAGTADADTRSYVWTYEYMTLSPGSAELEYYQTEAVKDRTKDTDDLQQLFEIEYGITDRLDAALYQVYDQKDNGGMKYSGFKARLRYRIAEKDRLPLDILLYAEHQEKADARNVFEGKIIFAKDIGRLHIAYNQVYKNTYHVSDHADHEYAAGISYPFAHWLRIAVESKGNYRTDTYAAGPTLAFAGSRLWANIGVLVGLNDRTKDREVRFLMGIPF